MGKLRALILLSLLCSPLAVIAQKVAQKGPAAIELGTPVERQLGPGQNHEFTVKLEEDNFIQLVVEQRGIDVIVKAFTPTGKSIGEFDSPNGTEGPEHVSFVAATAGSYRITVSPLDPWDTATGRYEVKLLEVRAANDQELTASKNLRIVKARGIALVKDIEEIIPQIRLPYTRIKAQLRVGNLLWETDEKLGAKFFSDAMISFKEFLASIDADDKFFQSYSGMSQLRYELVQMVAQRDPEAALNFLYSTQMTDRAVDPRERAMQERNIELLIADQLIRKDPARALKLARQTLKTSFSPNLVNTIRQLRQQNPEMAVELANEIVNKLLNEKLLKNTEAANLATGLLQISRRWTMRFEGSKDISPRTPLLRDDQYRELMQKMLAEVLSYSPGKVNSQAHESNAAWNLLSGLQAMGPSVETIITGGEAAIQKKLAEISAANNPGGVDLGQLQNTIATGSTDASLQAIDKAPPEYRDRYYLQLANHLAGSGELERAKQIINDRVTNHFQRREFLNSIEQQRVQQAMQKGKVEEALRIIGGFRNIRERAQQLAPFVFQIGPGQKRAAALNLLEQARAMLNPALQAQDQDQMNALLEIARAFSRYDSKRAFEIVDPLIDQFNELSAAAKTLDGFGHETFEDGELSVYNGGGVGAVAAQLTRVLATLALTNFDQAKVASDRIRLPEVRLRAYLDIAEQAIQASK